MVPRIIAICGHKRSGKDTIANYLAKYGYKNIKIADQLKTMVKQLFNFTDAQLELDQKEDIDQRWEISPRQVMQFFGTEIMQYEIQKLLPNIGRTFWIKSFIEKYRLSATENTESENTETENAGTETDKYVISDMRFLHEYEELKKYNIFVIMIKRDSTTNKTIDFHASENEYIKIPADIVINNDGTIEDLLIKIDNAISTK